MIEWIEKNVFALFAFFAVASGWFVSLGRLLSRVKEQEEETAKLIAQLESVRYACSGQKCAEQQNVCFGRFVTRKEWADFKRELSKEFGEIKGMISKMENRRESARAAMLSRWDEIAEFMGEMRARTDTERRR